MGETPVPRESGCRRGFISVCRGLPVRGPQPRVPMSVALRGATPPSSPGQPSALSGLPETKSRVLLGEGVLRPDRRSSRRKLH